jgi:cytochrome P450
MQNGRVPFAEAFDRLQGMMDMRFVNPIWRITETFAPYTKDLATVRDFGAKIVKERRLEKGSVERFDILSLFLDAKDINGNLFSDKALAEHVLNFIIAGRDTTAQALSWTVYYLHQNPKAKKKLFAEICATLPRGETPTYDQIKNMKYANAVFHEALRLSPSVPKNSKTALYDDMLPDGYSI